MGVEVDRHSSKWEEWQMEKASEGRRMARCKKGVRGGWWAGRCRAMPSRADGRERAVGVVRWHVVPMCCKGESLGPLGGTARELALVDVED